MREIKLRCWDKETGVMTYNPHITQEILDDAFTFYDEYSINLNKMLSGFSYNPNFHTVWMLSTGITDKNGKEIYEGDIVTNNYLITGPVIFLRGKSVVDMGDICSDLFNLTTPFEVIGNIYENPELLNAE